MTVLAPGLKAVIGVGFDPLKGRTARRRGAAAAAGGHNLLRWSQDFTNAVWSKGGGACGGAYTAPDGTATAQAFTDSGTTTLHYLSGTGAALGTGAYVASLHLKAGGVRYVHLRGESFDGGSNWPWMVFDTTTATIVSASAHVAASGVIALAGGWSRVWLRWTAAAAVASGGLVASRSVSSAAPAEGAQLGNLESSAGVVAFYAWGAQLEPGTGPSAYTPTTASPAP